MTPPEAINIELPHKRRQIVMLKVARQDVDRELPGILHNEAIVA